MKTALPYELHPKACEQLKSLVNMNELGDLGTVQHGTESTGFEDLTFNEALARSEIKEMASTATRNAGWLPLFSDEEGERRQFYTVMPGNLVKLLFCLQVKTVPSDIRDAHIAKRIKAREKAVNDERRRAAEVEGTDFDEDNLWTVDKAEKQRIKEDVISELIPTVFPKTTQIPVFLALNEGLALIGAGSPPNAEAALSSLRYVLGGLRARTVDTATPVSSAMTRMLESFFRTDGSMDLEALENRPQPMDQVTLVGPDSENMSFKGYTVTDNQSVQEGLDSGNHVASIRARFSGSVEATLHCKTFALKTIKFSDAAMERLTDDLYSNRDDDERAALLDQAAAIILTVSAVQDLIKLCGGAVEWPEVKTDVEEATA